MELLEKFLFLYKSKYRRKLGWELLVVVAVQYLLLCISTAGGIGYECGGLDGGCENGVCVNNSCLCNPGWTGLRCQFCSGKIRLTDGRGSISDGTGNYTSNMKCTWLIESLQQPRQGKNKSSPIYIHFEEFATECGWDHLYIYDGDSVNAPLLGVFSGLLVQKDYKALRLPEVVAKSGFALLHFYTDVAYNLTGFNITYRTNSCPSSDFSLECSGNGACVDGICTCDAAYMGEACDLPKCPNNCSNTGVCNMELHKCVCNDGYGGHDCSQETKYGVWEVIWPGSTTIPAGTASHCSVLHNDSMWVIGGTNLNLNSRELTVMRYNFKETRWEHVATKKSETVPAVYGHSCIAFEDKIYLYGGVYDGKFGTRYISNGVWSLDLTTRVWSKIHARDGQCKPLMCGPMNVAGHTAVVINDKGNKSRHSKMVVIFGHSPRFGYVNIVQEFHFGSEIWDIKNTKGYPVAGSYGHTSTWDSFTQKIYVYGGYRIGTDSASLSSTMLSYDPISHTWDLLSSSPGGRFLHSSIVTRGAILVFGGNGHNDTVYSLGSKCFTSEVFVYDILCDTWSSLEPPSDLPTDVSRYGHTSVSYNGSVYMYGGFNGKVLIDLVKFTFGSCAEIQFSNSQSCLNSAKYGLKCQWNKTSGTCEEISSPSRNSRNRDADLSLVEICPSSSRKSDMNTCGSFKSCTACVQNSMGCVWCGNNCQHSKCKDVKHKAVASLEQCPNHDEGSCGPLMHNCHLCTSESSCMWSKEEQCVKDGYRNTTEGGEKESVLCDKSCSDHLSCINCTADHCMWCNNLSKCVDKNAYVISFPYGQCMSWSQSPSGCMVKRSSPLLASMCEEIPSCDGCRQIPSCGWCDTGAGTGLGRCMEGSGRGPVSVNTTGSFQNETACSKGHWYFTECPACQCNGHSVCDEKNRCLSCSGYTEGERCEKCFSGYYGIASNGGECRPCQCNNHADTCHHETGKCFCTTKGITGEHCDRCDTQNNYSGDPSNGGSCFYELQIDYQFTFNLSKKEDKHFSQINFKNSPTKIDIDAEFEIFCSIPAKMNLTVKKVGAPEVPLLSGYNCSLYKTKFEKLEHNFGTPDNTTFYVYVYDFRPPLLIRISFSQSPKLDLLHFFITFSTCFLLLLLTAAVLWKIKQKYDVYRRRQRLFVEMEQMASRPFAQVYTEIRKTFRTFGTTTLRKRKKEYPSPIALEPCHGNRAAVLSLLVTLPTGGSAAFAPPGQPGLSIGSTLVALGNPRKVSFDPITKTDGKNSKLRKSLPSHSLNTCI